MTGQLELALPAPGNDPTADPACPRTTDGPEAASTPLPRGKRAGSVEASNSSREFPHSCGRCGSRWGGNNTAHCAAKGCCKTFSGISTFDRHRRNGECLDPASLGMSLLASRPYPCWGYPGEIEGADW